MTPPLLYSTNVALKFLIHEKFRKDVHYAWCSEDFDATAYPSYSVKSHLAPTSNPIDIFRELREAVERSDRHCFKINEQKVSFKNLALDWESANEISEDERAEIIHWIDVAPFNDWRPLIYVIPRSLVEARMELVAPEKRSSFGNEYIVPDLRREEFSVIDLLSK